jgi:hypothetical protein
MGLGSYAVSGKRSWRRPGMLGVDLDGGNHQVEFVGAVDVSRHAIEVVRREGLGFGEVIEPVDSLGMVVLHQKDGALLAFRAREQRQVVGAKVEHGWTELGGTQREKKKGRAFSPAPSAAPMWG